MVKELARPQAVLRKGSAPDTAWAFHNGEYMKVADAQVGVMTHALNYGTGVFEGIRAYWNAKQEQLYVLHLREHFERLKRSCRIMRIEIPHDVPELCEITLEVLRRSAYRGDCYIRPLAYKKSELIGVRLHDLEDAFTVFAVPFGNYVDIEHGLKVCVSSWRRVDDNAIPARAKITGSYVNAALVKTDAEESGYDEAIVLTEDGHVSEASAANVFMIRDGRIATPPATDNILEGIIRGSIIRIAGDLGIPLEVRSIDRTELYGCDELFITGTGVQISPIISVDHRAVGDGAIGAITKKISSVYYPAVHGDLEAYREWVTPVYR